jgi:hypothetical protein
LRRSIQELEFARDEMKRFMNLLGSFVEVTRRIWGNSALGFGVADDTFQASTPRQQAILLLFWQRLTEDPAIRRNVRALLGAERHWERGRAAFDSLLALSRLPVFTKLLAPSSFRAAFRSSTNMKRLEERLAAAYRSNRGRVEQFLAHAIKDDEQPVKPSSRM